MTKVAVLMMDLTNTLDFSDYGVPNNAGTGVTGDILFTTIGAAAADYERSPACTLYLGRSADN